MLNAISVSECGLPTSRGAVPLQASQPFSPDRLYRHLCSRCPMPSCALGRDSSFEEKTTGLDRRMTRLAAPPLACRGRSSTKIEIERGHQSDVLALSQPSLTTSRQEVPRGR
jgi:hypothetical protein